MRKTEAIHVREAKKQEAGETENLRILSRIWNESAVNIDSGIKGAAEKLSICRTIRSALILL